MYLAEMGKLSSSGVRVHSSPSAQAMAAKCLLDAKIRLQKYFARKDARRSKIPIARRKKRTGQSSASTSAVPSSTSAVLSSTSAVPSSTSAVPSSTSAVPSSTSAVPSSTSAVPSSLSVQSTATHGKKTSF